MFQRIQGAFARRQLGRWRAGALLLVHLLFAAHAAHWVLAGRTLAPLEFSEGLHTLHAGVITAGAVFFGLAIVATLFFGRFFCGWACHILALQDLCAWMLRKAGIRPHPLRSRVLLWVPLGAVFYQYAWPELARWWAGAPHPGFRIVRSPDDWGSFVTSDLLRAMPGPWVTALTLLTCGFLAVYLLGSRSFCLYACPYGAILAQADRFSTGRVVHVGGCERCGICTSVCGSGVRVSHEINTYGMVIDSNCLKSMDCVSSCPKGALSFGLRSPTALPWRSALDRRGSRTSFTAAEEGTLAVLFLGIFLIYRGLYDAVPFLMSLCVGGLGAVTLLSAAQLLYKPEVRLGAWTLKRAGVLTPTFRVYAPFCLGFLLLSLHSAFVHYHASRGHALYDEILAQRRVAPTAQTGALAAHAIDSYTTADQWGLFSSSRLLVQLASLHNLGGSPQQAEGYVRRLVLLEPDNVEARLRLAGLLVRQGRAKEAEVELEGALLPDRRLKRPAQRIERGQVYAQLGRLAMARGDAAAAIRYLEAAVGDNPNDGRSYLQLGAAYERVGETARAAEAIRRGRALSGD